eukprot:CAMPEP_0117682430 /NCGR_PEP_ID=MMETSP0804-20121206/19656_1 /TAXON_ID=1074897 /ORGANISM="Tetraselmis astigmatica, Strain CCMP880" /LENGTH=296 /DNA_ID=CAMNT_0005492543 /DNA_START=14 /DNA_END=904 /DNA_ORIENTATION=-
MNLASCSAVVFPGVQCRKVRQAGSQAPALMVCRATSDQRGDVNRGVRPAAGAASHCLDRRQLGVSAALLLLGSKFDAQAEEATSAAFKTLYDPTLAYEFKYPTETASGEKLSTSFSRKPEKYSSAAPLSADARQRIVSELVDLKRAITVSVTVGPASGVLRGVPVEQWDPEAIAQTVLIDRSTARVTTGQRVALNSIETVDKVERDGVPYIYYEHVAQGAPNLSSGRLESFRHALAVTTVRPGLNGSPYLYTLNLACPDTIWDNLEPVFREAVNSFELKSITSAYIPPDKDPWLFF